MEGSGCDLILSYYPTLAWREEEDVVIMFV
jgi:hypothetical protein